MREINLKDVTNLVTKLLLDANCSCGDDLINALKESIKNEESPLGKDVLNRILDNHLEAKKTQSPMCQDCGIVVCFVEIGSEVIFKGDLYQAINEGVKNAYTQGYFRKSVVLHPLERVNTKTNTPAIIHVDIVSGDGFKITVAPKGGGSENMSLVKMLIPSDGINGIKQLVLDTIFKAGGKPCPPIIVGVGIGGNLEMSALLAKKAILQDLNYQNPSLIERQLENELLQEINELGIGPMGFGGRITALRVFVKTYPVHIASLPVAINIQCHASRHKEGHL